MREPDHTRSVLDDAIRDALTRAGSPPPVTWVLITADAPHSDGRTIYSLWAPDGTPPHIIDDLLASVPDLGEDDD